MGAIGDYPESPSLFCSSAKPRGISTRNETKRKPPGVETKRNENHRELLRLVSHPKRNTKQLQCTTRETKRNETEMGEKDSEAPFRFIRNFSVLSVTLSVTLPHRISTSGDQDKV